MRLRLFRFKTKSALICLVIAVIVLSFVSISLLKKQNSSVTVVRTESIVALEKENGTLTTKQTNALDLGAAIKLNGEIYRLNKDGEKRVYVYSDENAVVRKYITVAKNGTYEFSSETDKDYVNKAILSAALTEYLKTADLDGILKDYATDSDVSETLNAALTSYLKTADFNAILKDYATSGELEDYLEKVTFQEYMKKYLTGSEVNSAISSALLAYVKSSQLNQLCTRIMPAPGTSFNFENGCAYLTFCLDSDGDVTDFYMIGGTKAGSKGQFALTFCETPAKSITVFQTGSIVLSDLAKTSDGSTGIRPNAMNSHLVVFRLGGKTVN